MAEIGGRILPSDAYALVIAVAFAQEVPRLKDLPLPSAEMKQLNDLRKGSKPDLDALDAAGNELLAAHKEPEAKRSILFELAHISAGRPILPPVTPRVPRD